MPKYTKAGSQFGPLRTTGSATLTREGGVGAELEPKTELFLTAINSLMEDTYYESADTRIFRLRALVEQIVKTEPEFVAGLVRYLRHDLHLRSISVVLAAEYVAAGGPHGKDVIDSAMLRADEPAEFLAYWKQYHNQGKGTDGNLHVNMAIRKGLRQSVGRLYNERSALRWDPRESTVRMGDVIDVVHPVPRDQHQSDLFRYLLTKRHHPDGLLDTLTDNLTLLGRHHALAATPVEERRKLLAEPAYLDEAGFSWERLSSWLSDGKGMDAEAWEAIIPSMGYMALLRNLRNFDQAVISNNAYAFVAEKLGDPDQVAASKQLPMRFFSAYRNAGERWHRVLEHALELSMANVPSFDGSTLILVDTSGSMSSPLSQRSTLQIADVAALFGVVFAKRNPGAQFVSYASEWETVPIDPTKKALKILADIRKRDGRVGHGTNTFPALEANYAGHDRVVIFTDMQTHPHEFDRRTINAPIYTFVLGGYSAAHYQTDGRTHIFGGGFSDGAFRMLSVLEGEGIKAIVPVTV